MALLPRRSRSFVLKLLLLIPACWFFVVLIMAYQDRVNNGSHVQVSESDLREKRDNPSAGGGAQVIQGFGPPIQKDKAESLGGNDGDDSKKNEIVNEIDFDKEDKKHKKNIPKPKQFVIDSDNPIYKHEASMPGEKGAAVVVDKKKLTKEEKKEFDDGWQNNAFNEYASKMISIHRTLPDIQDKECIEEKYSTNLPDTSVIVVFHNEAWSVLLRTVHSVLERSTPQLLKEVVLVDDYSDKSHLQQPLVDYMAQFPKVRVVRMEKREGLIRARLKGASVAKGKVLTFLDSHCECMEGWLEPLVERIHKNSSTVVCPVIDVIDDSSFAYHYSKAYFTNVGGFDWSLQFNWHPIPERDRKNRRTIDPVASPTMAGGLFSIDRDFFEKLGAYDPGFDIWGGENLEISFKIWMCGGVLEIVPCSHVGHIFRKRSPYKWRTGVNVLKRNSIRLAEVWMDEYKKYYYERINWNLGDFGDVSPRKKLRTDLQCKSFKWYLDTIYPELFIPGDAIASGEVRNQANNGKMCLDSAVGRQQHNKAVSLYPCHGQGGNQVRNQANGGKTCLDSPAGEEHNNKPVSLYPCHDQGGNQIRNRGGGSKMCLDWGFSKNGKVVKRGHLELYWCHNQGGNQYWMLSKDGEIRRDESCVDFAGQDVMIFPCHGMKGNQHWKYDHKLHKLLHVVTNKCLEMGKDGAKLQMESCDSKNSYQQWVFKTFSADKADKAGMLEKGAR